MVCRRKARARQAREEREKKREGKGRGELDVVPALGPDGTVRRGFELTGVVGERERDGRKKLVWAKFGVPELVLLVRGGMGVGRVLSVGVSSNRFRTLPDRVRLAHVRRSSAIANAALLASDGLLKGSGVYIVRRRPKTGDLIRNIVMGT